MRAGDGGEAATDVQQARSIESEGIDTLRAEPVQHQTINDARRLRESGEEGSGGCEVATEVDATAVDDDGIDCPDEVRVERLDGTGRSVERRSTSPSGGSSTNGGDGREAATDVERRSVEGERTHLSTCTSHSDLERGINPAVCKDMPYIGRGVLKAGSQLVSSNIVAAGTVGGDCADGATGGAQLKSTVGANRDIGR